MSQEVNHRNEAADVLNEWIDKGDVRLDESGQPNIVRN